MRINVEKCEKMMKNIGNEELGQIYASQSQNPGCFTQSKEKKEEKKAKKNLPISSARHMRCKTPLPHLNLISPLASQNQSP